MNSYEFWEHALLYILSAIVVIVVAKLIANAMIGRLKSNSPIPPVSGVLERAEYSLRLACSLKANAQALYDQLIGDENKDENSNGHIPEAGHEAPLHPSPHA